MVELVNDLIRRAVAARASDVHFEPINGVPGTPSGLQVRFRVDGLLHDIEELPSAIAPNVLSRLKVMSGLETYRTDIPQEGAVVREVSEFPCDVRVATIPTIYGERVVLRVLAHAARLISLDDLGHDPALIEPLKRLLERPQGLILVCGPVGSGKTTTVHAAVEYILSRQRGLSILSIEDPVEIRHKGVTQVEINARRGLTYSAALHSLLRQDPQVLVVGEVRDEEVARLVIEAAFTGHLVLTTMHSGSPAEAIIRLREMGVPPYQLTSSIRAILSQRLLRLRCQRRKVCKTDQVCNDCVGGGYSGRIAIGHCVEMTAELRAAILAGADVIGLTDASAGTGSLHADAQRLLSTGKTREEEIRRVLGAG